MTWKIGLVGAGYWSENHLSAWQRSEDRAQVVGLCDLDGERAASRGRQFGIPTDRCFTSLEAMLAKGGIDAVDIVTRPESHVDLVCRAAQSGLPILCQKPFAPDAAAGDAIIAAAQKASARLMVTENWRWMAPIQALHAALQAGETGRIQAVRYRHKRFSTPRMGPDAALAQPYFRTMPRLLFYEMGVHWWDTWRFLFGMPTRLYAEFCHVSPHVAGEDVGIVVLVHENENGSFIGHLDASWASREEINEPGDLDASFNEAMVIDGERATLRLTPTGKMREGRLERVDAAGSVTVLREGLRYDTVESIHRLQTHFLDCLETGQPFQTSGDDNRETLRLTFAAYESADAHRAVTLEGNP